MAFAPVLAGESSPAPQTIGFALTDMRWAVYQSADGRDECPQGLNESSPRVLFDATYPSATVRGEASVADTQLEFEGLEWHPTVAPMSTSALKEVAGEVGFGWNLDGKPGPRDFTTPDGQSGVDNALYRAIGCVEEFRGPTGIFYNLVNRFVRDMNFNRVLIEISGVDDLNDDGSVEVTIYRGLDRLMVDATGQAITPGGSQRVDSRWGKRYIQHLRGRIARGVLITEPAQIKLPHAIYESTPGEEFIRDGQFRLKLSKTAAEGQLVGYVDIRRWYYQILQSWNGQISYPLLWATLQRCADAYPDPSTGANTAASAALALKFTQVFILHDEESARASRSRRAQ
jgi:hypothetical protein